MVERRVCSFCGNYIEPGTGRLYIKKDGTSYNFCTSKCRKNLIVLRRTPHRTEWTKFYAELKQAGGLKKARRRISAKKIKKLIKVPSKESNKKV
jgi:large subunit ribosomal protein L24e